jgi:membrane protein required for colicin V production
MQLYDLLMIAVLAGAILFGAWKGLAWQVAALAAIFVSYLVALRFRGVVAPWISAEPPWNTFIAMFILYIACSLVIWVAFGFVKNFIERVRLNNFDRQAGAVLGAVTGATACMIITLFAVTLLGPAQKQSICQSMSGQYIARSINQLSAVVPSELQDVLTPYLTRFNQEVSAYPVPTNGTGTAGQPSTLAMPSGFVEAGAPTSTSGSASGVNPSAIATSPPGGSQYQGQVSHVPSSSTPAPQWVYDSRTGQWIQQAAAAPAGQSWSWQQAADDALRK